MTFSSRTFAAVAPLGAALVAASAAALGAQPTSTTAPQTTALASPPPAAAPARGESVRADSARPRTPDPSSRGTPATAAQAAALPQPTVSFFGEVRTRGEADHPAAAAGAPTGTDAFTYLRSRLGARAAIGDGVRLVMTVQDSRVLGTEGLASAGNALDMYEGYVEVGGPWRGSRLAVRAGRQEIVLGNERLVGRVNWSNTGRTFDGVRLTAGPAATVPNGATGPAARAPWTATAFAATLAERNARFGGTASGAPAQPDHYVFGLAAARPLALLPGAAAELTVVHDRGVHARGLEVTGRTTVAGRLRAGRVLGASLDLEGAAQGGTEHALATATAPSGPAQTIRAWMLGARVGTPTAGAAGAPVPRALSAAAGVDLLSGDASATDVRDGAFSTLYASNHAFYGLEDVVGGDPAASLKGRGLVDAYGTTTVALTRALSLRADLHRMASARTGGVLGWEADVVAPFRVAPGATVELGYGAFRAGDAGAALGLGRAGRVHGWGYLQLTAGF